MKVLHVSQPSDGGVARYVMAACLDQAARGWEVTVACPDGGHLADDVTAAGLTRLRWDAVRSPGGTVVAEARALSVLIARTAPDVVHLHSSKAGLAGRLGRHCTPVVFQPHGWSWLAVHGPLRVASLAWERYAARRAEKCLCVSDSEESVGRENGVRGRYAVVRNGVDLTRFQPFAEDARAAARSRLGLPAAAPLAVCVGRITVQKGQDVLLRAWRTVHLKNPDARLALVGDGDLALRAAPGVTLAGPVDDVRDWLAAADVVVLPSRWEGLSLSVLEALAVGRSVVASDIPGLAEAVGPDCGELVVPENPDALAAALSDRLGNEGRTRAEGLAAARYATRFDQRLTFDRLAEETLEVSRAA